MAHQTVHAAFGTQEAMSMIAADFQRGTLEAGHVTLGFFQHLDLEIATLAIAQIHAQQH